jgi:phage shock protein PspC (stress-responsive transcriptional regulator)
MSEHITHTPSIKRLERNSSDRYVAGVAGGLGRYFDLNPTFFRIGFVILTLLGGAGVLIYLAALLVMPEQGSEQSIAERVLAERRDHPWPLVGLGLAAAALIALLAQSTIWPAAGAGWVIVLLAGLVILWTFDASRSSRRARRLVVVGVTLFTTLVVAAIVAVAVAFAWFDVSLGNGVGDRVETPASVNAVKPTYKLGVGDLRIDLSQVGPISQETHVKASVGVGELRIIVPQNIAVAVDAHAKVGDVYVLRRHDDGRNASVKTAAKGLLVINARVGAGRIDVVRAGG